MALNLNAITKQDDLYVADFPSMMMLHQDFFSCTFYHSWNSSSILLFWKFGHDASLIATNRFSLTSFFVKDRFKTDFKKLNRFTKT